MFHMNLIGIKMKYKLDELDWKILKELKKDSKLSMVKLAERIGEPSTTIYNRIKKMEEHQIIKQYTIRVDKEKLYGTIVAFIVLQVDNVDQKKIMQHLLQQKIVEEAAIITGSDDIIIRIRVETIDDLNKFILDYLRQIDGITKSKTMISLDYYE